jgi:hypothetical protein
MLAEFTVQFTTIHELNLACIHQLLKDDRDLDYAIKRAFSRVLNSFHLLVSRLQNTASESELDDYHPEKYWLQLENANHREIELFLLKVESNQLSPLEIALLFQLIRDHSFYMGQLHLLCQQHNIAIANEYLYKLNLDE